MYNAQGFRGYVGSRSIKGNRVPQHIQNIVIRHYCETLGLRYLLSAVEMAMEESFLAFRQVISEISTYQGVVAYSIDQLPGDSCIRQEMLQAIVDAGREIHFAVERIVIRSEADVEYTDTIVRLKLIQSRCLSGEEFRLRIKNPGYPKLSVRNSSGK